MFCRAQVGRAAAEDRAERPSASVSSGPGTCCGPTSRSWTGSSRGGSRGRARSAPGVVDTWPGILARRPGARLVERAEEVLDSDVASSSIVTLPRRHAELVRAALERASTSSARSRWRCRARRPSRCSPSPPTGGCICSPRRSCSCRRASETCGRGSPTARSGRSTRRAACTATRVPPGRRGSIRAASARSPRPASTTSRA